MRLARVGDLRVAKPDALVFSSCRTAVRHVGRTIGRVSDSAASKS
jgi:hypothetical protein